mgnify:CR=1 FL=1
MTPVLTLLGCATLLLLLFYASIACYSLRGFSRAELDELCEQRGKPNRFLDILKNWEAALVAWETLLLLLTLGYLSIVICHWNLLLQGAVRPASFSAWFDFGMRWTGLLLSLLLFAIVFPRSVAQVSGEQCLYRFWPVVQSGAALFGRV